MKKIQNFNIHRTIQKQDTNLNKVLGGNSVSSAPFTCYGADAAQPCPRLGNSTPITLPALTVKAAPNTFRFPKAEGMSEGIQYAKAWASP